MWYLLAAGTGLAGGIAAAVWAIVERGHRLSSERTIGRLGLELERVARNAEALEAALGASIDAERRLSELLDRKAADDAERMERAVRTATPEVAVTWLDSELAR